MLAFIVVISGLVACGDDTARDSGTVRGFITEVTGSSLTEFETLALEDDNGTTWLFESNGKSFLGFTPSHLREHMVQGQAIVVKFHHENEVLLVDEISD
jgi:hypothetical protein